MTSSNGNIFRVTGPLCGEFTGPTQRPVTRSFDVFFDLRLNKRLSKHSWGWWFKTLSWSLCRHFDGMLVHAYILTYKQTYIHTCMFVVVDFDVLEQVSDFRIERRQVVFLCWISKLGSLRHQIDIHIYISTYVHTTMHRYTHVCIHTYNHKYIRTCVRMVVCICTWTPRTNIPSYSLLPYLCGW